MMITRTYEDFNEYTSQLIAWKIISLVAIFKQSNVFSIVNQTIRKYGTAFKVDFFAKAFVFLGLGFELFKKSNYFRLFSLQFESVKGNFMIHIWINLCFQFAGYEYHETIYFLSSFISVCQFSSDSYSIKIFIDSGIRIRLFSNLILKPRKKWISLTKNC